MIQEALGLVTILLLLFIVLVWLFSLRVRAGHIPILRRIPAFEALQGLTSQAVESGRPIHLSLGLGSMANETAADSLAALSILNYLGQQAAVTGVRPTVSMADPTVMLFVQNALRAAYEDDLPGIEAAYRNVRWLAPQAAAYAAGVMSLLSIDNVETNIMVGNFGDEYLLMGEASVRQRTSHIAGTSVPNTLPFIYASAQKILLGEEIYAAGAYLQKLPAHLGSLLAQDTMRWIIAATILAGVAMTSLGIL